MAENGRAPRGPDDPRDTRKAGDPRDARAVGDAIDSKGRLDPVDEVILSKIADGMLQNAAAMDHLAGSIKDIGFSQRRMTSIAIMVLSVLTALALIVVFYLIPINKNVKAQANTLLDCITPSSPGTVHTCSDRSAQNAFNLIVANVRCTINLPPPVHTDQVRQCVADTLGVKLNPQLQPNP